jgi:DNA-binding MarR family transcriptional regulator
MIQQSPDVTRLINRLESSGLAARGKSEDDRRLSLTYITKTGLELLEQMQPAIDEMVTDFSLRITVDEALTLTELCERVAADSPAE